MHEWKECIWLSGCSITGKLWLGGVGHDGGTRERGETSLASFVCHSMTSRVTHRTHRIVPDSERRSRLFRNLKVRSGPKSYFVFFLSYFIPNIGRCHSWRSTNKVQLIKFVVIVLVSDENLLLR